MALLFRLIGHVIFSRLLRRGMKIAWIRWTLAILFTLFAAASAALAFIATSDQSQQFGFGLGAFFFLMAGGCWYTIFRYRRALRDLKQRTRANVKQLIAEGKLVTLPAASPAAPKAVTPDDVASVERYIQRVRDIFEKNKPTVTEYDAPGLFRQTMQEVVGITGRYDLLLNGPAMTFASLPKPWRDVGAAEVMYRLSFLRGDLFVPAGLRQGLVYAFHAQFVAPLQPDALLVQLRIYSGYNTPVWREKAAKTMDILNRYAASHPGLSATEMVYRRRIGQFDRALECADLALNGFLSPTQSSSILDTKASILQALKRNDEAVAAFQQALAYYPNPWTWHNLSILLDTMGALFRGPRRQHPRARHDELRHGAKDARDDYWPHATASGITVRSAPQSVQAHIARHLRGSMRRFREALTGAQRGEVGPGASASVSSAPSLSSASSSSS